MLVCSGAIGWGQEPWFGDVDPGAEPGAVIPGEALLLAAVQRLEGRPATWPEPAAEAQNRIVLLTLSDGQSEGEVVVGGGLGWRVATERAVEKARQTGIEPTVVKLDAVRTVQAHRGMNIPRTFRGERSLTGIAFSQALGVAFTPDETVARTLINSKGKLRLSNMQRTHGRRAHAVRRPTESELRETPVLYTYTSQAWGWNGDHVEALFRGHRRFDPNALHDSLLLDHARQAGQYLTRAVRADGQFDYAYRPKQDELTDGYNLLRHCGTVFAMLDLHQTTADSMLLSASVRALEWMVDRMVQWEDGVMVLPDESGDVKVGGQGLALVALAQYAQQTGDRQYLGHMQGLARYLLSIQQPDGRFVPHKQDAATRVASDFVSGYYPGEAMLGLARLHALDGDPQWVDAAMANARYLTQGRDAGLTRGELPHDHWLLYALRELHRARPEPWLMEEAERYGMAIVAAQRETRDPADWTGSFYSPPRCAPSATRAEGLLAAHALLLDGGDAFGLPAADMLRAAERAMAFCLQLQFDPLSAIHLDAPRRTHGGFRKSMTNYTVQIDYVQHSLSALLALMRTPAHLRSLDGTP